MKEYITIKNFGPINSIERLNIKPYTVFIGESASGKSTIMKLVCMMRYLYKMANIRSYLKHSNITNSPFKIRFDKMMKDMGMFKILREDSIIEYTIEVNDNVEYTIKMRNRKLDKLPIISSEYLSFNKISFISEHRNIIPIWTQQASGNSGAKLGFYFHETNSDFISASNGEKEIQLGYMNMRLRISHPKGKPTSYEVIPNDNRHKPIELREASSGIQTSASLALIIKNFATEFSFKDAFKRSVINYLFENDLLKKFGAVREPNELSQNIYVHIEEPELSLFPDAQCKLIDELFYTSKNAESDRKLSLMFATHSPYILNYLNIILNQNKKDRASLNGEELSVYRIYQGEAQNLIGKNNNGKWLVDTYDLSETMDNVYKEFLSLNV